MYIIYKINIIMTSLATTRHCFIVTIILDLRTLLNSLQNDLKMQEMAFQRKSHLQLKD